jgi:hypothetical protein
MFLPDHVVHITSSRKYSALGREQSNSKLQDCPAETRSNGPRDCASSNLSEKPSRRPLSLRTLTPAVEHFQCPKSHQRQNQSSRHVATFLTALVTQCIQIVPKNQRHSLAAWTDAAMLIKRPCQQGVIQSRLTNAVGWLTCYSTRRVSTPSSVPS